MKTVKSGKRPKSGARAEKKPEMKVGKILLAKKAAEEKEMKEGKYVPVSERPGTVNGSDIMAALGKSKEWAKAREFVYEAAKKASLKFKSEECCKISEFKEDKTIGVDPDMPGEVRICGISYMAHVYLTLEKWKDCVSAFSVFMEELERLSGREAFVQSMKYDGTMSWDVIFRIEERKPSKRQSKGPSKRR